MRSNLSEEITYFLRFFIVVFRYYFGERIIFRHKESLVNLINKNRLATILAGAFYIRNNIIHIHCKRPKTFGKYMPFEYDDKGMN